MLTRSSVHCAESIVAMRSSRGLVWSRLQRASGYSFLSVATARRTRRFLSGVASKSHLFVTRFKVPSCKFKVKNTLAAFNFEPATWDFELDFLRCQRLRVRLRVVRTGFLTPFDLSSL